MRCEALPLGPGRTGAGWTGECWRGGGRDGPRPASLRGVAWASVLLGRPGEAPGRCRPRAAGARPDDPCPKRLHGRGWLWGGAARGWGRIRLTASLGAARGPAAGSGAVCPLAARDIRILRPGRPHRQADSLDARAPPRAESRTGARECGPAPRRQAVAGSRGCFRHDH